MNEILFDVLKVVVSVVCMAITVYLVPWLKAKLKDTKTGELLTWVTYAVKAAEQMFQGEKLGEKRKKWVIEFITEKLGDLNVGMTYEQIEALIEACVYTMNNGGVPTTQIETKMQ